MSSLAIKSKSVADELYEFLRSLDPARFREEYAEDVRERFALLHRQLRLLNSQLATVDNSPFQSAVTELLSLFEEGPPDIWNALRIALLPHYEELIQQLKHFDIHSPSLRPTNYARNIFHVSCSLTVLMTVYFFFSETVTLIVSTSALILAWGLEASRRFVPAIQDFCMGLLGRFAHPHEAKRVNSSSWFVTAVFILALLSNKPLLMVSVGILGISDPLAAVIGRKYGTIALVYGRSVQGSLTFWCSAMLVSSALVLLMVPSLSITAVLLTSVCASTMGTLAELLSKRVDDNLSIPLAVALGFLGALRLVEHFAL
ncbi:MAG: hypothetical protein VX278_19555 [Myxococcota bacterium]|nr:hypothetical protein [Myxococcota bacterium]